MDKLFSKATTTHLMPCEALFPAEGHWQLGLPWCLYPGSEETGIHRSILPTTKGIACQFQRNHSDGENTSWWLIHVMGEWSFSLWELWESPTSKISHRHNLLSLVYTYGIGPCLEGREPLKCSMHLFRAFSKCHLTSTVLLLAICRRIWRQNRGRRYNKMISNQPLESSSQLLGPLIFLSERIGRAVINND